jgi:hypothetical protein
VGQRRRDLRSVRQFPSINFDVNGKYPIAKKARHDTTTEFFTCTNNDIHSLWANFVNDLQIRRLTKLGGVAPKEYLRRVQKILQPIAFEINLSLYSSKNFPISNQFFRRSNVVLPDSLDNANMGR